MLQQAIETDVFTEQEAETFRLVHDTVESYMSQLANELTGSSPGERETEAIHAFVADGTLTEAQV